MNKKTVLMLAVLMPTFLIFSTKKITVLTDYGQTRNGRAVEFEETEKIYDLKNRIRSAWNIPTKGIIKFQNLEIDDHELILEIEQKLKNRNFKGVIFQVDFFGAPIEKQKEQEKSTKKRKLSDVLADDATSFEPPTKKQATETNISVTKAQSKSV